MNVIPDGDGFRPGAVPDGAAVSRRLVAVAVSAADVLSPESDLRTVAGAAAEVDVLVTRVDSPGSARLPFPADAPDYPDADAPDSVDDPPSAPLPARGRHRAAPDVPAGLHLHHLDLRWRVQDADEPDIVAALSELIGFDPDDHVFFVAPATGPEPVTDPELQVVERAVRRVARVYGLPVLHYRPVGDPAGDTADEEPEPVGPAGSAVSLTVV